MVRNQKIKQRSISMDDETFALLTGAVERERMPSLAYAIRKLIWDAYGPGQQPAPVNPRAVDRTGKKIAATKAAAILPDENAGTFTVNGNKVRTANPRGDSRTNQPPVKNGPAFDI